MTRAGEMGQRAGMKQGRVRRSKEETKTEMEFSVTAAGKEQYVADTEDPHWGLPATSSTWVRDWPLIEGLACHAAAGSFRL